MASANSSLALVIYQNNGLESDNEVIDLLSDDEEIDAKPPPYQNCMQFSANLSLTDDLMAAETAKRGKFAVSEDYVDGLEGVRRAASVENAVRSGRKARGCAGVIPLGDADVIDWDSFTLGDDAVDDGRRGDFAAGQSAKRNATVKITRASKFAKPSPISSPSMRSQELETESSQREDLDSPETGSKVQRMRGAVRIKSCLPSPLTPKIETCGSPSHAASSHEFEKAPVPPTPSLLRASSSSREGEDRKLVWKTLLKYEELRLEAQGRGPESCARRPDLKAGTIMKEKNLWLNRTKKIGSVPGIEVGDQFHFRIELCIIGLHRQVQGGIDFLSPKQSEWEVPVATSVIASGGYEDDVDNGETLIYTGQGGNNSSGSKLQAEDQKLERGNLALMHSFKLGMPVRVIRGCKSKDSPSGTVYTYDGLYRVENFWLATGLHGCGVYKFQLQRLPGQAQTAHDLVKPLSPARSNLAQTESIVDEDISRGEESPRTCQNNAVGTETTANKDTARGKEDLRTSQDHLFETEALINEDIPRDKGGSIICQDTIIDEDIFVGEVGRRTCQKTLDWKECILNEDISRGKESQRVCIVNDADTATDTPGIFEYVTRVKLPPELDKVASLEGCECLNGCSDPALCCCIKRNGGSLPYTVDKALDKIKSLVYECGPHCRCPLTCQNRVGQHGIKHKLEVFKKGGAWGLRSWDFISAGSFVCEYTGQLVVSGPMQRFVEQRDHVLCIDSLNKRPQEVGAIIHPGEQIERDNLANAKDAASFNIDAREFGNAARFISHNCSPNLHPQFVLYDRADVRFPHVMLFALKNIRPFTELTFDYGKLRKPASKVNES